MEGFQIRGKAFVVSEELRRIGEQFKGWTVAQLVCYIKIQQGLKEQFGEEKK